MGEAGGGEWGGERGVGIMINCTKKFEMSKVDEGAGVCFFEGGGKRERDYYFDLITNNETGEVGKVLQRRLMKSVHNCICNLSKAKLG